MTTTTLTDSDFAVKIAQEKTPDEIAQAIAALEIETGADGQSLLHPRALSIYLDAQEIQGSRTR